MRADRDKRARDPHRRGHPAVRDPHRRGREAVRDPARRGRPRGRRSCGPRPSGRRDPAGRGRGPGDRDGLPGDPRRAARTRRCSSTSTSRCCRRSPRATPTRCGSCRARSARRSRAWASVGAARGRPSIAEDAPRPAHRVDPAPRDEPAKLAGSGRLADAEVRQGRTQPCSRRSPTQPRRRSRTPQLVSAVERARPCRAHPGRPAARPAPPAPPASRPRAGGAARRRAIVLAGLAAGTINAVVGSGTLITFPTLLALGVPPVIANVSNTIGLVPGSFAGAWGYRRELAGQRAPSCSARGDLRARRRSPGRCCCSRSPSRRSRRSCRR